MNVYDVAREALDKVRALEKVLGLDTLNGQRLLNAIANEELEAGERESPETREAREIVAYELRGMV